MLQAVKDGPAIVACNSCRFSPEARQDADGVVGGGKLVEALHRVKASSDRYDGVDVQEMPCLFACKAHCTIHLRAPGKISYVLGHFLPDEAAARAILDYAVHYAESEDGRVAYAQWPNGVRGHFITRAPPIGFVAT